MSAVARFAPGDWYAVVGDQVTVLLPGSQRGRVAALWDLVDAGALADDVLDALLAAGLSSLDHFALVAHHGDTARLLIRGAPSAAVSSAAGDEVVSHVPGTAWAERLLAGVTGIRVTLSGDGDAEHVLTPGLARVSVVEFGVELGVELGLEFGVESGPGEPDEPDGQHPMSVGEAPVPEDDWSDRDGQTMVGRQHTEFERPPIPGQESAPEVVSQPVASLVFSTGDVIAVDRTVLVGRAPEARRFAAHEQPHVVTVPSPHQEISSTHLEIRPGAGADHGSAIVTDLGSTNGTVLAQPGLDSEELTPGIAVSLVPGAVLDLGDGVTIQVTNA